MAFLFHANEWLLKAMRTHFLTKPAQLSVDFRSVRKFPVLSSSARTARMTLGCRLPGSSHVSKILQSFFFLS